MESPKLHVGEVDFTDETLLVLGDEAALDWLAARFASRQVVDLAAQPEVEMACYDRLRLIPVMHPGRLLRTADGFDWEVSASEAERFVEQLRSLAASRTSAHTYLDPDVNAAAVEVVVSKGEYDPATIFVD